MEVYQGGELTARGADSWHLPIGLPGGHGIMEGVRVDESRVQCRGSGGGFKYFFIFIFGEMIKFDYLIFFKCFEHTN